MGITSGTSHADDIKWSDATRNMGVVAEFVDRDDWGGKSVVLFLKDITDDEAAIQTLAHAAVHVYGWLDASNVYVSFYKGDDCLDLGYWRSFRFEYGKLERVVRRSEIFQQAEVCDGSYPDSELFSAMAEVTRRLGQ